MFQKIRKKTTDLLVAGVISPKFLKNACINKFQITLEIFLRMSVFFRQGFIAHFCPLVTIEKWKKSVDKGKNVWNSPNKSFKALPLFHHYSTFLFVIYFQFLVI